MSKPSTITLIIDGKLWTLPAEYLNPGAVLYWTTFIAAEARKLFNPWPEFSAKISGMPPELQAVAVQAFVGTGEYRDVPEEIVQQATVSLRVVQMLGFLVTGEQCVTEQNLDAARLALFPFRERLAEIVCESVAHANALRAQVGKPPIGAKPTG